MPRAPWEANDNLALEVRQFQARYTPGDVIEGIVRRRARSHHRPSSIRLIFFGRVKTSFRSGSDNYHRRANVVLFETVYRLYDSAADEWVSTASSCSWPFRITIPSHPVPRDHGRPNKSDKLSPEDGYLSNEGDVSTHALPGTFSCQDKMGYDQFVEYVLKAELHLDGEGARPVDSTLPINIQPRGTLLPIPSFAAKVFRRTLQPVRSPKCLPENASRDLRLSERIRSKISGRTPYYAFRITVIAPTVLQLNHPRVFPLKIYVTPRYGKEFSNFGEGDPYKMPPTMFNSLKLKLIARPRFRGLSSWINTEEVHPIEHRFTLPGHQQSTLVPILMPEELPSFETAAGQDSDAGDASLPPWSTLRKSQQPLSVDESKALDLGEMFKLKPHRVCPPNPYPSFKSYNLSLHYFLEYKIDMRTVDEDHRAEGLVPVTLLAPSEETQAEMRESRAQRTVRHEDVNEWSKMTGAQIRCRDAPVLLEQLFGSAKG